MDESAIRNLLLDMFDAAVQAALPQHCLPAWLPPAPSGRTIVIGAGKAAASMARALEQHWDAPLEGLVVTRYGHGMRCERIEVIEAAHPVPDEAGRSAAERMLGRVRGLRPEDLVICLLSGGGSSLLPLPLPGVSMADKQALNRALLASGATISEINCVRRHLSAIKGGRLAAACRPARVVNLVISDVPGDAPLDIASGPTVPDPTTCADALDVLRRHRIELSARLRGVLDSGAGETIKPGDARLPPIETRLIATPLISLEAAADVARKAGVAAHILGDALEGEAGAMGRTLAGIARHVADYRQPFRPPCVLISGGESTVQVRGDGRGGRNVEFLLSLAIALGAHPRIHALAADTDGVDGIEAVAGAVISPDTLSRAFSAGLHPADSLARNDGHGFFAALGDGVITGPTLTNVNDFRAIFVSDGSVNS